MSSAARPQLSTKQAVLTALLVAGAAMAAPANAQSPPACEELPRDPARLALVIGNSEYRSSPRLPNAANDARAVKDVLERCLGFSVILAQDLSRDALVERVREFGNRIVPGGVSLFYYAGHGVEQDGRNYLIPVSHGIRSRADIPVEAYPVDDTVKRMESGTGETGVNIVIIDACRNNPLPSLPAEGRDFGWRSLAPVVTQSGTLVMHSTRSGAQALDQIPGSRSRNSPFTAALVEQIVRPEISLRDLPYEITAEVRRLTNRLQEPWASASFVPALRLAAGGSTVVQRPQRDGGLRITTSPAGARVSVDGRDIGTAPLESAALPPGVVTVRAVLPGHSPVEAKVTVKAGESQDVQLSLSPLVTKVRLTVEPQPPSAHVRLIEGPAYRPGVEVPPGDYAIEVSAPGYQTRRETMRLSRSEERVALALERSAVAPPPEPARLRALSELQGASSSWALGINARGEVLGMSSLTVGPQLGFVWTATTGVRVLDSLGGLGSMPAAINDRGDIVGTASNTRGDPRAFLWTEKDGMRELPGLPAGAWTGATAINNAGDIVGMTVRPGAFSTPLGGHGTGQRAYLYRPKGGVRMLGSLGGETAPADINERREVVGWSHDRSGRSRAFIWSEAEGVRDLGTFGGALAAATAINAHGQVVGWAENAAGQKRAFLWTPESGMQDLGTLGGNQAQAMQINDDGWIVGTAHDAAGEKRAFLWRAETGMQDLGTLGGTTASAIGINTLGQIVGMSQDASGRERAFLWAPRP